MRRHSQVELPNITKTKNEARALRSSAQSDHVSRRRSGVQAEPWYGIFQTFEPR